MSSPKKNTAYVFYISLVDSADTGAFKATPTLAAGDFQVSGDGAAFANLTTLPVVNPAGSIGVKVSLSAAEMNFDKIMVQCIDAAGAEWDDVLIFIDATVANVDDVVRSTTPANTLAVDADSRIDVGKWRGSTPNTLESGTVNANVDRISGFTRAATVLGSWLNAGRMYVTDSGTTTAFVDASLTQADDYWNNSLLVVLSGTSAGHSAVVTDFDAATNTVTFTPASPFAISTDSYVLLPGLGLANIEAILKDAQSAADLKDFADAGYDPSTNKVQGVVLVDTTTTNTDMLTAVGVVDEWETQSQADPTGFHVNLQEISGDLTAVSNLKTMLDGTGGQTLSLGRLVVSGNNAAGVVDIDNSGGPGVHVTGSTHGVHFVGSDVNSHGLYCISSGHGIRAQSSGGLGGIGLSAVSDSSSGAFFSGAVNYGLLCSGPIGLGAVGSAASDGHGAYFYASGSAGNGLICDSGSQGHGIAIHGSGTASALYVSADSASNDGLEVNIAGTGSQIDTATLALIADAVLARVASNPGSKEYTLNFVICMLMNSNTVDNAGFLTVFDTADAEVAQLPITDDADANPITGVS